nr:hypothetical transcript [Hymenolepis microstoma]
MSTILLLRGKIKKNKPPKSSDIHEPSAINTRKLDKCISLPPDFLRVDGAIGWRLGNAKDNYIIELNLNTFEVFLNGECVRHALYQIMDLKRKEDQVILRISFAAVLGADSSRRVIEIKADINSDFHLCAKSFMSEFLTPAKLVNLAHLGLSFNNWCLSLSKLL